MLDKVVYQVYPKSFKDTTNNGVGDLNGVNQKLDYIKSLNVDYIWLTPFYKSPQKDNGYDVADYYEIDPLFGTMEDLENLIKEAQKRNMGIMLDMVFNHCSTEHQWFKKAMSGDLYYKDFFIWSKKPTNWQSKFGGSAWEYCEQYDEYYLHLFDKTQADLNWENENVRNEIYKVINFWISKGIKGFRFDVINLISKRYPIKDGIGDGRNEYTDGPRVHEFLNELRSKTFNDQVEFLTVGEMSSTSVEQCVNYVKPERKELTNAFHFHHLKVDYKDGEKWSHSHFDFPMLKELFKTWQEAMDENNCVDALFWSNHDQGRIASRFDQANTKEEQIKKNKMLAVSMYLQKGISYIYQGEEIGMENNLFTEIDEINDVESINYYNHSELNHDEKMKILNEKSRDHGRTPMQWSNKKNADFSDIKPWINVNKNYNQINVSLQEEDKNSTLNFYRDLINFKKENTALIEGKIEFLNQNHEDLLIYRRYNNEVEYLIICNYFNKTVKYDINPEYKVVMTNNNEYQEEKIIRPFDFYVLKK